MITTALQYSGGKDSRAVLHMHRDSLDSILVVWANAGSPYPEVAADIRALGKTLPHFLEVVGNQPDNIRDNGYPTDVLPLRYSPLGRQTRGDTGKRLQSVYACCAAGWWQPLHQAMVDRGIKTIIRGQRNADAIRNAAFRDGETVDGFLCKAPIQDWTDAQVWDYLRSQKVSVPEYYRREMTGRDCWNCTGYLEHNVARITNMRPDMKAEVTGRLRHIKALIDSEVDPLHQILEAA